MRNPIATTLVALAFLAPVHGQNSVSVYCSLDAEHSQQLLQDFEKLSGIRVEFNMDTEDNKTIGLVNRIISEASNPRCDVFWNNEVAHTIRLKNKGLLQQYVSPSAADIPAEWKDSEGYWTGFAARARVIIYNKNELQGEKPKGLSDLLNGKWNGRCTMARPLTGTTLTHAAALLAFWGEAKGKDWLEKLAAADIYWERGNAQVMALVGQGGKAWGYTDTDDAHVSKLRGDPTDIIIPDQGADDPGTLIIPNSVMILKGAQNLESAKRLVDYVLSAEVEKKLAEGRSAQIPVRASIPRPAHVLDLKATKSMPVQWEKVAEMLEKHGPYLQQKFEGGVEEPGRKSMVFVVVIVVAALALILFAVARRRRVQST